MPIMGKIFCLTRRGLCASPVLTGAAVVYPAFHRQYQCNSKQNKKLLIKLQILDSLKLRLDSCKRAWMGGTGNDYPHFARSYQYKMFL